jgi:hypothetical protein
MATGGPHAAAIHGCSPGAVNVADRTSRAGKPSSCKAEFVWFVVSGEVLVEESVASDLERERERCERTKNGHVRVKPLPCPAAT